MNPEKLSEERKKVFNEYVNYNFGNSANRIASHLKDVI